MNVLVQPSLDGIAAERLYTFAFKVAETSDAMELRRFAECEAVWAQHSRELNGQVHAYEAAARLLSGYVRTRQEEPADARYYLR